MYQSVGKRVLDIALVLLAVVFLAPVLVCLWLLVRFLLGSPVLFRQVRPGKHGGPFEIFKFRTMTDERNPEGLLRPDDQRLTSVGRILRATSLDELPELFNVLQGDMSLVGPRPLLMQYLERYTPKQARRMEVRPGITGWAQVNGRNALSWKQKFEYDVWYVDNLSLWLDLKILMMTLWQVIAGKGVTADGHATMPEFMGGEGE